MKKLITTPKTLIPILAAVLLVAAAVTLLVWKPWELKLPLPKQIVRIERWRGG